jgi:hypothetical protein
VVVEVTADLRSLAEMIVRLSDEQGSTPVIVMPKHLSLRPPFFIALAREVSEVLGADALGADALGADALGADPGRQIRFDWCLSPTRFFASTRSKLARFRSARLTNQLSSTVPATVEVTASISRPGGQRRDLVIGLCHETLELPPWVTAIRIL